ncbi:hypothetical protein DPMN_091656 [Dreissena polymorpha]|uniref:Uncharacterized protein n=1 Tax=Dreissena polymorpha TaxID=45954 RepID=A0A9D4KZY2_DREPO|nr:hypothetical protein DPMN_091656 [Dreissena polymorpha]
MSYLCNPAVVDSITTGVLDRMHTDSSLKIKLTDKTELVVQRPDSTLDPGILCG